ncbi:MORN repeat-containing protein [Candidatus Pelagibacter sp. HIMB1506]|uniref:MORN repeat-containing protein n=1 Tax=Candidatus Pelagibacter sp. HIMB1506 TaxID=3413337 RepID=UPI003F85A999
MKIFLKIFFIITFFLFNNSFAGTKVYPNGDEYSGDLKNGKREGKGTLKIYPFAEYVGEWKNDKKHGQGTLIDKDLISFTYTGGWKEDKKHGFGSIEYQKGLIYEGEWKNGKEDGEGKLTLPTGEQFVGQFKDGLGFFETASNPFVYDNTEIFYGKYKDGKKNGFGTLIIIRGKEFKGTWESGKLIKIQEDSTDESVLLQKGHSLRRNGYLNGAILYYRSSLDANPDYPPAERSLEEALKELEETKIANSLDTVCNSNTDDFEKIKFCLEKYLSYKMKPVHPSLIKDFLPKVVDGTSNDVIISINLKDSFDTNQYSLLDNYKTEVNNDKARVRFDYKEGNGYFIYEFVGATDNGSMVIKTWNNTGGSAVFQSLLILNVKKRQGVNKDVFNSEGIVFNREQIILEKLLSISLEDKKNLIKINGNSISVNESIIKINS